jgi:hypothetical protein
MVLLSQPAALLEQSLTPEGCACSCQDSMPGSAGLGGDSLLVLVLMVLVLV